MPERTGGLIVVTGVALSWFTQSPLADRFVEIEWGIFGVDLAMLIAFVLLALSVNRLWPLFAAGFQLTAVWGHLAMLFVPERVPAAYSYVQGFWAYPVMIALVLGTIEHRRRLARERQQMHG